MYIFMHFPQSISTKVAPMMGVGCGPESTNKQPHPSSRLSNNWIYWITVFVEENLRLFLILWLPCFIQEDWLQANWTPCLKGFCAGGDYSGIVKYTWQLYYNGYRNPMNYSLMVTVTCKPTVIFNSLLQ